MRRKNRKLKPLLESEKFKDGRKRRTSFHKGVESIGLRKLPRKLKKSRKKKDKKEMDEFFKNNEERLRPFYGDDWISHIIFGG